MNALQHLSQLHINHQRRLCPSAPSNSFCKVYHSDRTTVGLTNCVLDYIRCLGGYAASVPSQHEWNEQIEMNTRIPTAAIHACLNAKHLSIDINPVGDKQSASQRQTQKQVAAAGGLYFLANDFQGFYDWLNNLD